MYFAELTHIFLTKVIVFYILCPYKDISKQAYGKESGNNSYYNTFVAGATINPYSCYHNKCY